MDLKKIVHDAGAKIASKAKRLTTSTEKEYKRISEIMEESGDQNGLKEMRRRAISYCVSEKSELPGQDMKIYGFLNSYYEQNRKKVYHEYKKFRKAKRRVLSQYGISTRNDS